MRQETHPKQVALGKKVALNGVKIERSQFTVCPKFFNAGDRFAASSLHRNRPDTRSRDESPCPSRHQSRVFRKKESDNPDLCR